jgi:hypothetical protein
LVSFLELAHILFSTNVVSVCCASTDGGVAARAALVAAMRVTS